MAAARPRAGMQALWKVKTLGLAFALLISVSHVSPAVPESNPALFSGFFVILNIAALTKMAGQISRGTTDLVLEETSTED